MISRYRIKLADAGKTRRGFTLVELLVSVAVAAVLLALLLSVISRALLLSKSSADAMTAASSAATAIDLIATDLASLAVTKRPFEYLQALPEASAFEGIQPMRLMMLIDSPEDSAQPSPSGSSTYPDSGQVRAVSYLLSWQNPISSTTPSPVNNSVFGLYRQVATSATTFAYVLNTSDLYKTLYSTLQTPNPPTPNPIFSTPPTLSTYITGNIVDLQVAFYACVISTGSGGTNPPPAGTLIQPPVVINPLSATTALPYQKTQLFGAPPTPPSGTPPPANSATWVNGAPLALNGATYGSVGYAEVSLTVLDDSGAKLWGDGTGAGSRAPAAIKQKYGRTLTRKIVLRTPQ